MYCSKCGNEMKDHEKYCPKCGWQRDSVIVSDNMAVSGTTNIEVPEDTEEVKRFKRKHTYISSTGGRGFVSPDEVPMYSMGNGIISHLISSGTWAGTDAMLTNRRLYSSQHMGFFNRNDQEFIVNVEDISGTKITNIKATWLLVLSIIAITVAVGIMLFTDSKDWGIFIAIIGLIMLGIYLLNRYTALAVFHSGGVNTIVVNNYSLDTVRAFQRTIYAIKEVQREES